MSTNRLIRCLRTVPLSRQKKATDVEIAASECASLDLDEITRKNQLNSPLLRLPGEIRNRVYEYVFSGQEIKIRDPWRPYTEGERVNPAIYVLATCRQILHEASSIFWNECIIDATTFDCSIQDLMHFGELSDYARITSLVVCEDIAVELYETKFLDDFPKLRKVYVHSYAWGDNTVGYMENLRRDISAKGLEVEFRDDETWTEEELSTLEAS